MEKQQQENVVTGNTHQAQRTFRSRVLGPVSQRDVEEGGGRHKCPINAASPLNLKLESKCASFLLWSHSLQGSNILFFLQFYPWGNLFSSSLVWNKWKKKKKDYFYTPVKREQRERERTCHQEARECVSSTPGSTSNSPGIWKVPLRLQTSVSLLREEQYSGIMTNHDTNTVVASTSG